MRKHSNYLSIISEYTHNLAFYFENELPTLFS